MMHVCASSSMCEPVSDGELYVYKMCHISYTDTCVQVSVNELACECAVSVYMYVHLMTCMRGCMCLYVPVEHANPCAHACVPCHTCAGTITCVKLAFLVCAKSWWSRKAKVPSRTVGVRGPSLQGSPSLPARSSSPGLAQCGNPRPSFGFWEARAVWG